MIMLIIKYPRISFFSQNDESMDDNESSGIDLTGSHMDFDDEHVIYN